MVGRTRKAEAAQKAKPASKSPQRPAKADTVRPAPPFLAALARQTPSRTPLWLMRQAGRYLPEYRATRADAGSFLDLCYNPALAAEVTLQPIRRFGFDASIIFSDILMVPHALGQTVEFLEGEGPRLDPVSSGADFARLDPARTGDKFALVYEAIERVVAALGHETPLIGFCGAPWTVATYMIEGRGSSDQRAAKLMSYRDRADFAALIGMIVEASATYLIGQVKAGARVLQVFDSWAGSLSDVDFEDWVIAPTVDLLRRVRAVHPDIPVIGFPRGSAPLYQRYVDATGVQGLGCDTAAPLAAMQTLQASVAVQGNLDPILLVAGGDAMQRRVEEILAALSDKPFVFNLGHGILPDTPIPHVEALVRIIRERSL